MALTMSSKEIAVSQEGIDQLTLRVKNEWQELVDLCTLNKSKEYKALVDSLDANWVGADCEAFKAQMEALCKNIRNTAINMRDLEGAAIERYKGEFYKMQNDLAKTVKNF